MKKIAITGANGTIGRVLQNDLKEEFRITSLDLPAFDARSQKSMREAFSGHDAVIHLAWQYPADSIGRSSFDHINALMTSNIYEAVIDAKVPRVIMASSIHADDFITWEGPELLTTDKLPVPTSPYGASKVFMEALGRYYAKRGLEVVCIRFGGINLQDALTEEILTKEPYYPRVWFRHKDCVSLVKACVEAESVPKNYSIVYGVSENSNRIHDLTNPFGWSPADS